MLSSLLWKAARIVRLGHRELTVHEYQGIELMKKFGISVAPSYAVSSSVQAGKAAKKLGGDQFVVKAQVQTRDRKRGTFTNGLQGGVHCVSADDVGNFAACMLEESFITEEAGLPGVPCNKVLVSKKLEFIKEIYCSMEFSRETAQGNLSLNNQCKENFIERVVNVDIKKGINKLAVKEAVSDLGLPVDTFPEAVRNIMLLYNMFLDTDAIRFEISPILVNEKGQVYFAGARLSFDDHAAYRQHGVMELFDQSELPTKYNFAFEKLNGTIGCIANGAGSAMATCDCVHLHGGTSVIQFCFFAFLKKIRIHAALLFCSNLQANFIDIGNSCLLDLEEALGLVQQDPKVNCLLINLSFFEVGCTAFAQILTKILSKLRWKIPIVLRLQGPDVNIAQAMLAGSGFQFLFADSLDTAANQATKVSDIVESARTINTMVTFTHNLQTTPSSAVQDILHPISS
eukprot:m.13834 g.13834  ORF g.13834 m.13834 type:complete len:457 (-) comp4936_c0_seq1:54-1424(-)